jgi:hypothetical protein
MPDTLHYHSISCACEQCIRVDERIPSVSRPVTIAFELCRYYEFHKFMHIELRCGFSKDHTSKRFPRCGTDPGWQPLTLVAGSFDAFDQPAGARGPGFPGAICKGGRA